MVRNLVLAALMLSASLVLGGGTRSTVADESLPATLRETGLYSDFGSLQVDPKHLSFSPQYPLWTDGAAKRRWVSLPPDGVIDASDPDEWVFPVGTRFWKEFSFDGQRVETRFMERLPDGKWLYAAYEWSQDGREAVLAPKRGRRGAFPLEGGRSHTIPGITDCKVCHQASPSEVLGFTALQLSSDRDPGALHSEATEVDVESLIHAGLLVGMPESIRTGTPRIQSRSALERAALGYLHGNCGHCHNPASKLKNLGLFLRYDPHAAVQPALLSTVLQPIRKAAPGQSKEAVLRIDPGRPERSALAERIGARAHPKQMPPLGTELIDQKAFALIQRWITELQPSHTRNAEESVP